MFQNAARPRGRPRGFDEAEALGKATQVFWSKGFDGATIDDLVAGMGVGRPSLYSVFGDKRTMFLRVLKAYAETKGAGAAKALFCFHACRLARRLLSARRGNGDPGRIGARMSSRVRRSARRRRRGPAIPAGRGRCRRGAHRTPFPRRDRRRRAPPDFPAAARASQVLDLARGLTVRAQMGASRKTLLNDAKEAVDLVLLPRVEMRRRILEAAWRDGWSKPLALARRPLSRRVRAAPRWIVFVAQLTRGMSSTTLAGNSAVAGGIFAGLDGVAAAKSVDLRWPEALARAGRRSTCMVVVR